MVGGAFFMVYFLDGWVMGLDYSKGFKMPPLHFDTHTVGYLVIALIYIIFALTKH